MLTAPRYCPGGSLLVLLVLACNGSDLVEPVDNLPSMAASGSTLKAPSGTSAAAVSQTRVDVSWQDNSTNESGFELYRSTAGVSGAFALLATSGAGVTSHSDGGLTSATQYCYKVRAFRRTGSKTTFSAYSATACATTPAPPTPTAPSVAEAVPVGGTIIAVHWTDNSTNEDGFRLERSTDDGASWFIVGETNADGRSIWDDGRTTEQQVCYRVIAFNSVGDSPSSNTDCTAPPAGPTGLTATLLGSSGEVDLTWADNSSVEDGYDVYADDAFGSHERIVSLPANSTGYRTFSAAQSYVVEATKDGGHSDPSNIAVTQCDGPDCPQFCSGDFDCELGYVCGSGLCVSHCGDGIRNRDESDVDCGGNSCGGCAAGQACWLDSDCASGVCGVGYICQP